MIKEIQYTSIRRVLDNLMEHPLLRDLTLDQAIRYTIRFIGIHGFPKLYHDKSEVVPIECFKGLLPCDLISIIQVKDLDTGIFLRSMTDTFTPGIVVPARPKHRHQKDILNNAQPPKELYIPSAQKYREEPAFKTQGRIIYTSFPKGCIEVMYKSIPVDEDGFPLLIDNENYLACLEAYIKKQVFTIKYDTSKLPVGVLQNAQQEYAWLAGELDAEFTIPSMSEMESITRMWNTMVPKMREFDDGFKHLGDREYLRKHTNRI